MICEHLNNGVCAIASRLAGNSILPVLSQCEYCTKQATPSQSINKVTVSLAITGTTNMATKANVMKSYGKLLTQVAYTESQGPALWRELFLIIQTESQLNDWESRIPNYQCRGKCKKFYLSWKKDNPPKFPLSFYWKWKLKNAVNEKLGQKIMSLDDAFAFWSSQRGNNV